MYCTCICMLSFSLFPRHSLFPRPHIPQKLLAFRWRDTKTPFYLWYSYKSQNVPWAMSDLRRECVLHAVEPRCFGWSLKVSLRFTPWMLLSNKTTWNTVTTSSSPSPSCSSSLPTCTPPTPTACWNVLLEGHSQLWDRSDLDTSLLTLKKVHPNLKSKFIWQSASIFAVFCLMFNRLLKTLFLSDLLRILWYYFYQSG